MVAVDMAQSSGTQSRVGLTSAQPVLINGAWREARYTETFHAIDPKHRRPLSEVYPVSSSGDIDDALHAADLAAKALRRLPDAAERIAAFLEGYANAIEADAARIVEAAAAETALPATPRLSAVELPRTTGQLRQAAKAARDGTWLHPTIDTAAGIRSCYASIGPVLVIGPNNFPFAFNGISGGDFAAAIAAGNPVIAKAHPLHPTTSRLLAEAAHAAAQAAGLPAGTVQMLYHVAPNDGLRMVRDERLKAVAFTGSRQGGMKLKAAADAAGKLFYGEMSSINPTVILPGALAEKGDDIAAQLATSLLMGSGQFCTKPGLVLTVAGDAAEQLIKAVAGKMSGAPGGVLFSEAGEASLKSALRTLEAAGADVVTGGAAADHSGYGVQNTLLRTTAQRFLGNPQAFQTEAFGNAGLIVVARDLKQLEACLEVLEGNLTGTVYSSADESDDAAYAIVAEALRPKVGRLLNDKMPTGVAVSSAMNHGGPFPATSQPHFTAVGIPAAISRFTKLESFDNVREQRLPGCLKNENPSGKLWRLIDGNWSQASL